MYRKIILLLVVLSGYASAHEWTPTYPKLEQSYVHNVLKVSMKLFNNRVGINHYEIEVFDSEWNSIKFAMAEKIIRIRHLERKKIDVFIREQDRYNITYVCSKSKIISDDPSITYVTSRICSKVKQ